MPFICMLIVEFMSSNTHSCWITLNVIYYVYYLRPCFFAKKCLTISLLLNNLFAQPEMVKKIICVEENVQKMTVMLSTILVLSLSSLHNWQTNISFGPKYCFEFIFNCVVRLGWKSCVFDFFFFNHGSFFYY